MDSTEQGQGGRPMDPDLVGRARSTGGLFGASEAWTGDESFVVDDLTDRESEAFWAALGE